jgi:NDP-sugar pyrophosphorylase family protein
MTQIVILAGGEATRLYPLTTKIPKSMIMINGVPFIVHQLNLFKRNGISDIVICAGVFSEKIIDYLGDGSKFGVSIRYSIETPDKLLGTLGALKNAYNLLETDFLLIFGDSYLEIDYQAIYSKFLQMGKLGLMTVVKNEDEFMPNNVEILDGLVIKYDKKKPNDFRYVDYGLSAFKKSVLDLFPKNRNLDLSELNKKLISTNNLAVYEVQEKFYEIGSIQGIKDFEKYLSAI